MIRCVPSPALPAIPESVPDGPEPRPRVSAIVLNRDGADHLRQLFQSMLPEVAAWLHEIIVIDHGSRDDSVAVCHSWSDRLPVRCVAFERNHSFSWSNNRAAERASGDYLLLLNNDIRFEDNPLPAMLAAAQATGGAVGVGQQHVAPDGTPDSAAHIGVRLTWDPRASALRPKEAAPGPCDEGRRDALAAMPAVTASVLVVARETYLRLGGMNEGYDYGYEDIDFALTLLLAAGLPVSSLNGTRILHQEGGTRRRRARWSRARRLARNRRHFRARWAYPAWRWWTRACLSDPGALLGRRLAVRIAPDPHRLPGFGFDAGALADWRSVANGEAPEVVVVDSPADVAFAGCPFPRLATLACLDARDVATWRANPAALSALDLAIVRDEGCADSLREAGAARVVTDASIARDGWQACLPVAARVGLVSSGVWRRGRVDLAASKLVEAGHPVRVAKSAWDLTAWADVFVPADGLVRDRFPPGAPVVRIGRVSTLVSRVRAADRQSDCAPAATALPCLRAHAFPEG
mgnify:FL=1